MASRNRQSSIRNRLCQDPGTITGPQLRKIHTEARKRGLDRDALHDAAGVDSLKQLSRVQASELIERLTGQGLPNPPGHPPKPPKRKGQPGVTRMITAEQVEQIVRLAAEYFPSDDDATTADSINGWLRRSYVDCRVAPEHETLEQVCRKLNTAEQAGQVIAVLKAMTGQGPNLPKQARRTRHTAQSRDRKGADTGGTTHDRA